jgi:hypothetical protein
MQVNKDDNCYRHAPNLARTHSMVALAYDSEMEEPLPLLVHVDDALHEYPTAESPQQPVPRTASFAEPVSAISRNSFFTSRHTVRERVNRPARGQGRRVVRTLELEPELSCEPMATEIV